MTTRGWNEELGDATRLGREKSGIAVLRDSAMTAGKQARPTPQARRDLLVGTVLPLYDSAIVTSERVTGRDRPVQKLNSATLAMLRAERAAFAAEAQAWQNPIGHTWQRSPTPPSGLRRRRSCGRRSLTPRKPRCRRPAYRRSREVGACGGERQQLGHRCGFPGTFGPYFRGLAAETMNDGERGQS